MSVYFQDGTPEEQERDVLATLTMTLEPEYWTLAALAMFLVSDGRHAQAALDHLIAKGAVTSDFRNGHWCYMISRTHWDRYWPLPGED